MKTYTKGYAPEFKRRREVEWPFEVPVQQGMISGSIDLMLKYDGQGNILDANIIDFKAMKGPDPEEEQEKFHWTELALQVQLYAKAAREILGDPAYNGAVHFLKDDKRVLVPVQDDAVAAGVANVEWAIDRIVAADFPMRPHPQKCEVCDFRLLCAKQAQSFAAGTTPPPIHVPASSGSPTTEMVRAFSEFDDPAAGASTSTAGTTSP